MLPLQVSWKAGGGSCEDFSGLLVEMDIQLKADEFRKQSSVANEIMFQEEPNDGLVYATCKE